MMFRIKTIRKRIRDAFSNGNLCQKALGAKKLLRPFAKIGETVTVAPLLTLVGNAAFETPRKSAPTRHQTVRIVNGVLSFA